MRLTGTIGERITALRTEQHISQKELADLLYVNQGTVSRWERDIRYPDNDIIARMAKLFGVSSSVLAVTVADAPVAAVLDGTAAEGRITAGMLAEAAPHAEVLSFAGCDELLACARSRRIDALFAETVIGKESTLKTVNRIIQLYPDVNVVFVTTHAEFMGQAFYLHASGYVPKPLTRSSLERELRHLRFPVNGLTPAT